MGFSEAFHEFRQKAEQTGIGGSTPERVVTYPVRAGARFLCPLNIAWKRQGIAGGAMDMGTTAVGRVCLETLRATTGVVGYGIGMVRKALLGTLGYAGRIAGKAALNSQIIPFSSLQQRTDVASHQPSAGPDAPAINGAQIIRHPALHRPDDAREREGRRAA